MTTAPDLTADERATLERIEAAPAADEDTIERVARAICDDWVRRWPNDNEPWENLTDGARESYRHEARAAVAALKPAPGTDSSGQAVQRVLELHQRAHETGPTSCVECNRGRRFVPWPCSTVRAVAGPQRDHGEEA